jgi:hypothetical protein
MTVTLFYVLPMPAPSVLADTSPKFQVRGIWGRQVGVTSRLPTRTIAYARVMVDSGHDKTCQASRIKLTVTYFMVTVSCSYDFPRAGFQRYSTSLFHSGSNTPPLCGVIVLGHESSYQKKSQCFHLGLSFCLPSQVQAGSH